MIIYHITTPTWWGKWGDLPHYESETLAQEGFIHCCGSMLQVEGVLQRYFAGQTNLLLLHIEADMLKATLKYELATNQEVFPHIFGAINKDAITEIKPILIP